MTASPYYLAPGLPAPVPENDGLSAPFWQGLWENRVCIQRCKDCRNWQWGPEWICHQCHSFELGWEDIAPEGKIFSWQRSWHPVHPALKTAVPYITVLIELPAAGNIRMIGNLLGDREQTVTVGAAVQGEFEHHPDGDPPFTLLQWRLSG